MIGGEVAVRHPEIPLQFNGVARGERHHGLQPDRGGERAPDFGCAVQYEPPAHPCRGAGIDLVEKCGTEKVGAVHGGGEVTGPGIETTLVVEVGVVQSDLRPRPDAHVVVVIRPGLEARLVDDAIGVVNGQTVEEGAAVGGNREAEPVRAQERLREGGF